MLEALHGGHVVTASDGSCCFWFDTRRSEVDRPRAAALREGSAPNEFGLPVDEALAFRPCFASRTAEERVVEIRRDGVPLHTGLLRGKNEMLVFRDGARLVLHPPGPKDCAQCFEVRVSRVAYMGPLGAPRGVAQIADEVRAALSKRSGAKRQRLHVPEPGPATVEHRRVERGSTVMQFRVSELRAAQQ